METDDEPTLKESIAKSVNEVLAINANPDLSYSECVAKSTTTGASAGHAIGSISDSALTQFKLTAAGAVLGTVTGLAVCSHQDTPEHGLKNTPLSVNERKM